MSSVTPLVEIIPDYRENDRSYVREMLAQGKKPWSYLDWMAVSGQMWLLSAASEYFAKDNAGMRVVTMRAVST